MSTELTVPTRGPGRPLGLRSEPALRLAMGYRDEARKGAPVKTDYFIPKVGEDGSHAAAAAKFTKVYGDKPRAIDILLPPELTTALHVEHIAWGTGGMKARGATNFATVGTLGGPDVLTVWKDDGEVEQVEIENVDDPKARQLEVGLYTTFQFYIPEVLGAASLCAITSKGQKTTDNLFAKLIELYGYFGSRVTFIVKPKLVLRPATGRPVVPDRETGKPKRIKSSFFALDLYVPESFDEMFERLAQRNELLAGRGGPIAALYGAEPQRQIEAAPAHLAGADPDEYVNGEVVDETDSEDPAAADDAATAGGDDGEQGQQADEAEVSQETSPASASSVPGDDDEPKVTGGPAFPVPDKVVDEAGAFVVPKGDPKGKTLAELAATLEGEHWLGWALKRPAGHYPDPFRGALELFVQHRLPEVWAAWQAEKDGGKS
jgi:hypothetical protein